MKSEGGEAKEIVDEENGFLISAMLRQYFMALRTIGQWKCISDHWVGVAEEANVPLSPGHTRDSEKMLGLHRPPKTESEAAGATWRGFLRKRVGLHKEPLNDDDDDHFDPLVQGRGSGEDGDTDEDKDMDLEVLMMRKFWARWVRKAGVKSTVCDPLQDGDCAVDWTRVIAPVVEGRVRMVGGS